MADADTPKPSNVGSYENKHWPEFVWLARCMMERFNDPYKEARQYYIPEIENPVIAKHYTKWIEMINKGKQ